MFLEADMASFISIFLALMAVITSIFAYYSVKQAKEDNTNNLDEIMRLRQIINEMDNRITQLKHDFNAMEEKYKRLKESSLNSSMQDILNKAILDYNHTAEISANNSYSGEYEKNRKSAAENVLQACNTVCQHFLNRDLSRGTFNEFYKNQLQNVLNSDDLKDIYESSKSNYPFIERAIINPVTEDYSAYEN